MVEQGGNGQDGAMAASPELIVVLERARGLGVLGPGPVTDHVDHSAGFVEALAGLPEHSMVLDLGSGAGIPGLVIAEERPDLRVVLLDSLQRRVALLTEAVEVMGWTDRVETILARAEDVGRRPECRGMFDAVTSRSFGPPATVAECSAPLLKVGGVIVVSEPPGSPDRWPAEGLAVLGVRDEGIIGSNMRLLRQVEPCPAEYPRRVGIPAKRPLF